MKNYILYNPLAGNGKCKKQTENMSIPKGESVFCDMTTIGSYTEFFNSLEKDDTVIICGGDGTLNRFINSTEGIELKHKILYYAAGSGNDFLHDLGRNLGEFVDIKNYIKNLPVLTVEGKPYRFINGIGFGLDGYCCEEANRLRRETNKKINYTIIALKALLFNFKPVEATVCVDGKEYHYKKVWMATTMKGRYFGGGMKITPHQDRADPENKVMLLVAHNLTKFRILTIFPSIFKGKHIKYTKFVSTHKGHEIKVKFSSPTSLQIDGESVSKVSEYDVTTENKVLA